MRKDVLVALMAAWVAVGVGVGAGSAQEVHPFQVSLVAPIQAFPEEDGVNGVRLSLLYGKNSTLTGLDVGLVSHTTQEFLGFQIGLVGLAEGTFTGVQDNFLVNRVEGSFEGLQWGLVNSADAGRGGQVGMVNHSVNYRGLQFGIVNYAETIDGLQIGLLNIIKHGGRFPAMILVNWGSGGGAPND